MKGGPSALTQMRFRGIRLVEQTEQKFRHIQDCLWEKNSNCNSRAFLF